MGSRLSPPNPSSTTIQQSGSDAAKAVGWRTWIQPARDCRTRRLRRNRGALVARLQWLNVALASLSAQASDSPAAARPNLARCALDPRDHASMGACQFVFSGRGSASPQHLPHANDVTEDLGQDGSVTLAICGARDSLQEICTLDTVHTGNNSA